MRILGLPGDSGPCAYYRVIKPLEALHGAGMADTFIPPIDNGNRLVRIGDFSEIEKRGLIEAKGPWEASHEILKFQKLTNVLDYDLLLFQRQPNAEIYRLISKAQTCGIKSIFDIDDDAFNIPPTNPNYLIWGRDGRKVANMYLSLVQQGDLPESWRGLSVEEVIENAKNIRDGLFRNLRKADLVTTTTPALAREYKRLRSHIAILPNQMHPEDWQDLKPIPHRGEIWMGWAGGKTHFEDLKVLEKVIPIILERYAVVCFVIAGFPEAKERLFDGYPDHRVITFPWTDLTSYKNYLASFDIVLAPSHSNRFNEGKSDIRVLEAGMVRRPVVGSMTTYGVTIKESKGGFVVKRNMDWVKALSRLIEDQHLRKVMGENLAAYVHSERTYAVNAHRWQGAYSALLEA